MSAQLDLLDARRVAPHHPAVEAPLLDVRGLRIELASGADVVSDISFCVAPGHILGLVGESGSGKSTIAAALLGHARDGARIVAGEVRIGSIELLSLPTDELRQVRGQLVAHVAQDPASALNPLMRIGAHLHELLEVHEPALRKAERLARILQALDDVGLPAEPEFLKRFPHQLSGGQQQRVLLALAFVLNPRLIVLDEPTTALDVSTQAKVLATVRTLCRKHGVAAVYVSHDLAVVRHLADEVVVLYAGRVAEQAPLRELFEQPLHPYSQGLLAAIPDVAERRPLQPIPGQAPAPGTRPGGCAFAPRCPLATSDCSRHHPALEPQGGQRQLACLRPGEGPAFARASVQPGAELPADAPALLNVTDVNAWYGQRQVLFHASLQLAAGQCLALVGESGSGKTTLSRALAGLGEHAQGELRYEVAALALKARDRSDHQRREIQYIFQNPYRSLNPRHTVGQTLGTAARHFFKLTDEQVQQRVAAALSQVSLQPGLASAYPRELSGGERQRVAIARALICEPRVLICDEITSALDVSVQSTILDLLARLQRSGVAVLLVTHDLGVVRALAQQVAVLRQGVLVETGPVARVLDAPAHPYTRQLVADSPSLSGRTLAPAPRLAYRFTT